MIRYAAWTRRPEDPRTVWGWTFRPEHPYGFANRRILIGLVLFLLLIFGAVPLMVREFRERIYSLLIGAVPIVLAASTVKRSVDHDAHLALPTLGEETDAFPVTLVLFDKQKRVRAEESGWLTLTGGWLVYEGLRTAFSITPDSVTQDRFTVEAAGLRLTDGGWIEFRLPNGEKMDALLSRHSKAMRAFEGELRLWRGHRAPVGDAVYPPQEEHPSMTALWVRRRLVGGLAFVALAWASGPANLPFFLLTLIAGLGMIAGSFVGVADFRRRLPEYDGTISREGEGV